jgi:hypothetical protein
MGHSTISRVPQPLQALAVTVFPGTNRKYLRTARVNKPSVVLLLVVSPSMKVQRQRSRGSRRKIENDF